MKTKQILPCYFWHDLLQLHSTPRTEKCFLICDCVRRQSVVFLMTMWHLIRPLAAFRKRSQGTSSDDGQFVFFLSFFLPLLFYATYKVSASLSRYSVAAVCGSVRRKWLKATCLLTRLLACYSKSVMQCLAQQCPCRCKGSLSWRVSDTNECWALTKTGERFWATGLLFFTPRFHLGQEQLFLSLVQWESN